MGPLFDLDGIDALEIGRLMELLAGSDVEECEIERGEFRLSLRRTVRDDRTPRQPSSRSSEPEDAIGEEKLVIRAPAVGVFTRGEKNSKSPKVEVGSRVGARDVVGYIEVMMVPHSVHAERDGIVDSFLVEDGEPVEYGQPLVALRPL